MSRAFIIGAFSLIELLVVVAIVGILASLGAISYRNYILRARVIELMNVAETAQQQVMRAFSSNVALAAGPGGSPASAFNFTKFVLPASVQDVSVGTGGVVTVIGNTIFFPNGYSMTLTPTAVGGILVWNCSGTDQNITPLSCQ